MWYQALPVLQALAQERLMDKLQEIQTPEKVVEHAELLSAPLVDALYVRSDEPTRLALLEHCADRLSQTVSESAAGDRKWPVRAMIAQVAFDRLDVAHREALVADRAKGVRAAVASNATTLTPDQCRILADDGSDAVRENLARNAGQTLPADVRGTFIAATLHS